LYGNYYLLFAMLKVGETPFLEVSSNLYLWLVCSNLIGMFIKDDILSGASNEEDASDASGTI
jgi:hypothetical protein